MTLAFGMQNLFPFVPEARINAPMDAASPRQMVETSALHNFMASYIPIPDCCGKQSQRNLTSRKPTYISDLLNCINLQTSYNCIGHIILFIEFISFDPNLLTNLFMFCVQ